MNLVTIYVIKIEHLLGISKGHTGYHSVWKDKQKALNLADRLNEKNGRELKYTVEDRSDFEVKSHGTSVKFEDSVGWLIFADDTDLRHVLEKQGVSYGEFRNGKFFVTKLDRY